MGWRVLVTGAASKLKKAVQPKGSGLTPDQSIPGIEGMYSEAKLMEVDVELSGGQVKKVIKRFVQQGFQKQMPDRLKKSAYGDAPAGGASAKTAKAPASASPDAKAMATPDHGC